MNGWLVLGLAAVAGGVRAWIGWRALLRQLPDRNEDISLF